MISYLFATNFMIPLFFENPWFSFNNHIYWNLPFCVSAKRFSYIHQNQIQGYENLSPLLLLNNPSHIKIVQKIHAILLYICRLSKISWRFQSCKWRYTFIILIYLRYNLLICRCWSPSSLPPLLALETCSPPWAQPGWPGNPNKSQIITHWKCSHIAGLGEIWRAA